LLLDAPTLAAVALLGLGAAVIGGIGGFGTGVILTATLVPLIGARAVVPVPAVAGVIINAGRFWFYRSRLDRRTLGIERPTTLGTTGPAIGCGAFGLASGVATGTGVILVSVLLGTGPAVLATDALATVLLDVCKAALFQRFDLLDSATFATGVAIGIATIPGSAIAAWLVERMHARLHVLFMEALIVIGGLSMLWHWWS